MKSLYAAATLALAAMSANATAQTAQSGNAQTAAAKAGKDTKYCLTYDNIVGSRLTKTECRTKADWAREGVDVDRMLGK